MNKEDEGLLKVYWFGWHDELDGKSPKIFTTKIDQRAYLKGRADAIIGDDLMRYDETRTDEVVLAEIKEGMDTPEMMDWNDKGMEFYVDYLEGIWKYKNCGEAKAIAELIVFYRANKDRDPNRTETELYSIKDEWERFNAKTHRLIAEGTVYVHGTFTMEEAQAYVMKEDEREELPKFNQYRTHTYVVEKITSNPLV